jgi:hypothetical protein
MDAEVKDIAFSDATVRAVLDGTKTQPAALYIDSV